MIRYRPGRESGREWVPGRWEINAGVATATGSILTIAVATFIGLLFSVVACDEWLPLTGHKAAYRRMRRREHDAYIRYLERKVLER